MFENIGSFFKKIMKTEQKELLVEATSKDAAKERLHIVLMQDRANVSADFLELMKQEIIDVIKKYIVIDEEQIDVRLTNQENEDGTTGAPSLYANIPIINIRNDIKGEVLGGQAAYKPQDEKDYLSENSLLVENEEDDDITFDDLLKAAEEEERMQKAVEEAKKNVIEESDTSKIEALVNQISDNQEMVENITEIEDVEDIDEIENVEDEENIEETDAEEKKEPNSVQETKKIEPPKINNNNKAHSNKSSQAKRKVSKKKKSSKR